jgi:argininosuccinate lyase
MGEVVRLLSFHAQTARARLADGSALATDLAEALVLECGLDFRQAHRLVGHMVRRNLGSGTINELTQDGLADAAEQVLGQRVELSAETLRDSLNPEAAIAARTTPGGAAPEALATMAGECERHFAETASWAGNCRQQLSAAETSLLDQVRKVKAK